MFNNKRLKLNILIVLSLLVIIPFISIGFSALTTVLNIRGDLTVAIPQEPIIGNFDKSINNTYLNSSYRNNIKYIRFENNINIP